MKGALIIAIIVVLAIAATGFFAYLHFEYGTLRVYVTTGNVDPIYLTISSIMIHSTTKGWITLSNTTKTVELTQNLSFLASANVPIGNYTEVRLVVTRVTASIGGVNVSVSLPSGVLKIPIVKGGLRVSGGEVSALALIIGPHIIQEGNGSYILSPVVTAEQISPQASG
jgi:uncharacterized protein YxeA